ncbi:MAG: WG repeat-containing protein [Clostridia bacterium]|nr:WG repeat-containing protein [Clostridia bacterium]
MSNRRGRRIDDSPKLNKKKVFAVIITIAVIIMIIISLKRLLSGEVVTKKENAVVTSYFSVYDGSKWGVIDNNGDIVLNCEYDNMVIIPDKSQSIFVVIDGINFDTEKYTTRIINEKGDTIIQGYTDAMPLENSNNTETWYEENVLRFSNAGKYGLIDFRGNIVIDPLYDNIEVVPGIKKSLYIEKDGKKGLINSTTGEIIIEPQYSEIISCTDRHETGYIVKDDKNKYGLIMTDKNQILECKYDEIKRVASDNYYCAREGQKLEIINLLGQVVLDKNFDDVSELNADNFVIIKDGKYGVISTSGDTVIEAKYEDIKYTFQNNYIIKENGKYGIIDSSGAIKVPVSYMNISYIKEANFFEAEREDLKTDIIDAEFSVILPSIIVSELNIKNGYIRIREDQEYKYYNFKLEEVSNKDVLTSNTLYLIKKFGKYGYENKKGEVIVDCIYDDAREQNEYGYCAINKDGKWGCLKSDGSVVLDPSVDLNEYIYINFISVWHRFNDIKSEFYTK